MHTDINTVEKILSTLVGFDTVSRHSNRALIDWARDYLADYGIISEIIASADGHKANLWATIGASDKTGIMIAGHTDVVPVDGQQWTSDPFTLSERDGKLYGRGAVDMKGFIACALAFVPEFLAANTDRCFHLALTHDEETDMAGAQNLADYLSKKYIKPDWIWIGEPTSLKIIDEHKGAYAYESLFTGVAVHSGNPDKGVNAIDLAVQFMQNITAAAARHKQTPIPDSRFELPYTTFNLGVIQGGAAENIVAEQCSLIWQIRPHPGDDAPQLAAAIEKPIAANLPPRARLKTCVRCAIPPFVATAPNKGVETLKHLLNCDETHAVGFGTEAGIFQLLGAGAAVCGPGSIDQAHQADEFIEKSQLIACVDLMRSVLLSSSAPVEGK